MYLKLFPKKMNPSANNTSESTEKAVLLKVNYLLYIFEIGRMLIYLTCKKRIGYEKDIDSEIKIAYYREIKLVQRCYVRVLYNCEEVFRTTKKWPY